MTGSGRMWQYLQHGEKESKEKALQKEVRAEA